AAPASARRVGARPFSAESAAIITGTESSGTLNKQNSQVRPMTSPARADGGAPSSTYAVSIHMASTGATSAPGTQPSRAPGRDSRDAANRLAIATDVGNASLIQNIGSRAAASMSGRTPRWIAINNVAPNAPQPSAVA